MVLITALFAVLTGLFAGFFIGVSVGWVSWSIAG
jgi:hypothetical protein